jgi:type IV pilus assembly protein PilC
MPTFQYEAMNAAGQEVKAEIDAGTPDEAIAKIRTQGYFPTKVKEKAAKKGKGGAVAAGSTAPKKKGFNISIGGVSTKTITQFTRQLSTLQDAGLPILRSLKILWQQQKPGTLKNVLDGIANDVESGATLSEAMSRHPKASTVSIPTWCRRVKPAVCSTSSCSDSRNSWKRPSASSGVSSAP